MRACSNAFPSKFFRDLSLTGGTPATRHVPSAPWSGADSTSGREYALLRPVTAACALSACETSRERVAGRPKWWALGAPS